MEGMFIDHMMNEEKRNSVIIFWASDGQIFLHKPNKTVRMFLWGCPDFGNIRCTPLSYQELWWMVYLWEPFSQLPFQSYPNLTFIPSFMIYWNVWQKNTRLALSMVLRWYLRPQLLVSSSICLWMALLVELISQVWIVCKILLV